MLQLSKIKTIQVLTVIVYVVLLTHFPICSDVTSSLNLQRDHLLGSSQIQSSIISTCVAMTCEVDHGFGRVHHTFTVGCIKPVSNWQKVWLWEGMNSCGLQFGFDHQLPIQ